ncbi:MAG TPA: hypothetical protein VKX17_18940 [Planctomycetota bacterium]|nr:hypothetical protein [Planctomycetota bacterium]
MKTIGSRNALVAGLALGIAAFAAFGSSSASASEFRFGFRVGGGYGHEHFYRGGYCAPRIWGDGCYDRVLQHVVVCPERTERIWVEPVYQTTYDSCGKPVVTCVHEGFFRDVCYRARYEDRYVRVWHSGYYREY